MDLKFLVHFGEYTVQPAKRDRVVLAGLDVGLVRDRLLKDQATSGSGSYALFTEPSLAHMCLRPEGMQGNCGQYPYLGEICTGMLNLGVRYQDLTTARRAFVNSEQADVIITQDYPAKPPVV